MIEHIIWGLFAFALFYFYTKYIDLEKLSPSTLSYGVLLCLLLGIYAVGIMLITFLVTKLIKIAKEDHGN